MDRFDRIHRSVGTVTLGVGYCLVLLLSACGSDGDVQERELPVAERGERLFEVN